MMEYGLLGRHLSHSYSPKIHKLLWNCDYKLIEKEPEELAEFFEKRDFRGINVTIPYKKDVMPYLDEISDTARKIGSVNTILKRPDGTLYGDNTDAYGFEYMLKSLDDDVRGKKCIVLGDGGASQTVQYVLGELGAGEIVVISRRGEDNYGNISKHYDAWLIVNTTPVGMYPLNGQSPIELDNFKSCWAVLDLIYNPSRTRLLLKAARFGIPYINGLSMLVAQAMRAVRIWGYDRVDESDIEKTVRIMERDMLNIALIGMPGCGKSTVGRKLARMLGREFIDCDAEIVKYAGKSIPEIFAQDGEERFREIESLVLTVIAQRSGLVIATGGGVVTSEFNYWLLRQNSKIVFIDRNIHKLPSAGRPISQSRSIEDIARERMPKYRLWSDVKVTSRGIAATAKKIAKELGYENTDN